jgi:histone acetyltransferase 1
MEPFAKRPRVEGPGAVAIPAEEAITFHLLRKDKTGQVVLDDDGNFPPEMTHQLFGEEETIVGYDGLSIDIWLTPQFQAFIDVAMAGKGPGATPLREPFQGTFAAGFFEQKEPFDAALQEEEAIDAAWLGRELGSQPTEEGSTIRVAHAQLAKADPKLKALHSRMEPLLFFFVDAASSIDPEDPDWHLLTAVEETEEGTQVLGFATCYRHYHYPAGCRLRLAQILVLPPHQGRGVGSMLLTAAQKLADDMDACDLAVRPAIRLQLGSLPGLLGCEVEIYDWLQLNAEHNQCPA